MNLDNVKVFLGEDSLILETEGSVYIHRIKNKSVLRVDKRDLGLDSTSTDQEAALAQKIEEMERDFDTQVLDLRKILREDLIEDEEEEHLRPRPIALNYYSQYFDAFDWNTVVVIGLLLFLSVCVLVYLFS